MRAQEQGSAERPTRSCASSAGATSTPSSSPRGPRRQVDDCRPRGDRWVDDAEGLAAWKEGTHRLPARRRRHAAAARPRGGCTTGPGWSSASFLVKDLGIDWREGARHFFDLLLDGDVAQNVGNWQWVAGTGVDTRPNRVYNPTAQLKKLDPEGAYVRRYVPELADVPSADLSQPGAARARVPAADRRPRRGGRGLPGEARGSVKA